MKFPKSTSVTAIFATIFFYVNAQSSNYGSDFYIGSMRNYQGSTISYSLYLSTLSASSISYTVKDIYNNTLATGTVSVSSPTTVSIGTGYVTNSNTERNDGIHLSSTGPISVLVVNWQTATIGEYPAYPKQVFPVYQYEYYTASPDTALVSSAHSEILLVGTEDGTTVTITPAATVSVPTDVQTPGSPAQTLLAGETKVIILNRLQTFFFGSDGFVDMTGTSIVSDKPLTVISGHECANVPASKPYCEHVEEQIPPTVTWGKRHLVRSYTGKEDYSYLLIVSSEDVTTIKHNCGGTLATLSFALAGDHMTISLYTDNNCYIVSNKPILITQMMTGGQNSRGDPAVSALPPIEHYTNEVVFHSPTFSQVLDYNYINIVAQNKDTIIMDGQALAIEWEAISDFYGGMAGYSANISVSVDVHDIYSVNGVPFHVLVYGYSDYNLAGYSFSAGVGILRQLVGGKLQVKPWYGNILGGVPFLLKGPFFEENDVITCQFNEQYLPCQRVDEENAMCVSPRLTFTRRITIRLFQNDEKYISNSRFYSLAVDDDGKVNIVNNQRFLTSTGQVTLKWNPNAVIPEESNINASSLLLNITLYAISEGSESVVNKISTVATGQSNTGEATVTIPTLAEANHPITINAFFVTIYDDPGQTTVVSNFKEIGLWCTNVWIAFSEPDETDDILWNQCLKWAAQEPISIRNILLSRTSATPCPPTVAQARTVNSGLVKDTHYFLTDYFHPTAGECYRQRTITTANQGSGNECCYSSSGNLIVGPASGGSINKVDPRGTALDYWDTVKMHFKEDVVPYLFCCRGSKKNCQIYYDRRPSDDGSRYRPPVPACVYGDPHIVTLDLHKYTFNGKGEFILVETTDDSFSLQGRMVPVKDENNNDGKATVFKAIVGQQNDSDAVQFELLGSGNNLELVAYVAGEKIDFSELKSQEFENVTVTDTGNNTLNAVFSTGAYITVAEVNGLISTLIVSLPDMYRGKTRGLMGIYDNDTFNDLTPRGWTLPLSLNSKLKLIHEVFGMSFIISDEADSLFTYNNGDSFAQYYDPDFIPIYEPTFSDSDLEAEANEICGNDEFCKFDIAVSGRPEIGKTTKKGSVDFEMLQELSKPITCDPPCVHGACTEENVCTCSEDYEGTLCDQMISSPCDFNLCENGGTCQSVAGSLLCTCAPCWLGYTCETPDNVTEECINPPTEPPATTSQLTTSTSSRSRSLSVPLETTTATNMRRSTSNASPTSRPRDGSLSVTLTAGAGAGVGIALVIAVILVILIIITIVVFYIKMRSRAMKYPIEKQVESNIMGKANPAYEEMDDWNEENVRKDGEHFDYDDDEKKLVD